MTGLDRAEVGLGAMSFELPGGAHALFTDRTDGNMSSVGGVACEHAAAARERLRGRIGARTLARGYQVHGAAIARVVEMPTSKPAQHDLTHADGQVTSLAGVGTMVLAADCLPVAVGTAGAVAMLHAGWRGLAAGVLEEGVGTLCDLGDGGEIVAVIGPGAGGCCYEVGPEVHVALGLPAPPTQALIDLRAIAHARLLAAGVTRVEHVAACTICDERFFSYRREGERAGRQAGVAWLS